MNYGKNLFYIFSIIWEIGVAIQQICWIIDKHYSLATFIWAIIAAMFPYIIYKSIMKN